MKSTENNGESAVLIPSDCDVGMAPELHEQLCIKADAATSELPLMLDITAGPATAHAVQLLVAAANSLSRKGAFAGYGPTAATLLHDHPKGDVDAKDSPIRG